VLEKRGPNLLTRDVLRKIDPADLGAERARQSTDFYCSTLIARVATRALRVAPF
jgi:hypothetical protein